MSWFGCLGLACRLAQLFTAANGCIFSKDACLRGVWIDGIINGQLPFWPPLFQTAVDGGCLEQCALCVWLDAGP